MNTIERDYRYLLQHLIPLNRLPEDLRRGVNKALEIGNAADLRRCSILALESLRRESYYSRTGATPQNGYVVVTYVKTGGIYQLRLIVPAEEWQSIVQSIKASKRVEREKAGEAEIGAVPVGSETTIDILPDVIGTLSINQRHESIVERLSTLMKMLPEWLHFISAEMLLLQEALEEFVAVGERIGSTSEEIMRRTPIYEQVKSLGRYVVTNIDEGRREGLIINSDRAKSVAVVPVFAQDAFRGILQVLLEQPPEDESVAERVEVAGRIVEQVITINDQIENITSIDTLTRIYNRHFYETQLPIEIERATRTGGKLTMLLLDIDDFKSINDALGHKKGDEALSTVAALIKRNLRKIDLPFRYGGEEFVILLPGTAEIEAVHTAERLRSVIHTYTGFTDEEGTPRHITVSIGVAVFPDHARTEEELFVKADAAMFRAKHRGKNRVELYRE
ncbi:MAG: diguanylate cyclase [Candidatus Latescibacteria bacterium]|nr:diguanylate cyclase [Candidatus Latescibacterota bacterium]NIM21363.1 diguanylate cyclase [Candidatus Latescibacterota bacterium]NIM65544.1 diguanylate cyclase [Candidatus Latescibacterota bacterium]NIO01924.1 diguanylate cyclase [Candidatus Latescibacterota bacterium]NIO28737.1 diguanylate cyclase [Candidatus Latescibacterota bacterium]